MVGRIMKHELYALMRVLVFLYAAVMLLAVVLRLMLIGSTPEMLGVFALLTVTYVYAMLAAVALAFGLGVSRFYKTLFSGEGYLTLALPATPSQIILAKLLSALVASYASVLVCALSSTIFFTGLDAQVYAEIAALLSELFTALGAYFASDPMLIAEGVISLVLSIPMGMLVFYLFASLGQLFTRHRRAMTAVIAIGTIFVCALLNTLMYQPLLEACTQYVSPHLANWIDILLILGVDAGSFFLVRYILMHKVNLIV